MCIPQLTNLKHYDRQIMTDNVFIFCIYIQCTLNDDVSLLSMLQRFYVGEWHLATPSDQKKSLFKLYVYKTNKTIIKHELYMNAWK